MTNTKALNGSSDIIIIAPITVPINAPKIGISAVTPIRAPIIAAYGICKMSIPTAHNVPRITASVVCPATKDRNVTLDTPAT